MKKTDTVLFDFDGTIMDTNDMILGSWQHTFRTLTGSETDPDMLVRTFGEPLGKTMARFFPDVQTEESLEIYRSYQKDRFCDMIKLFPGIRELLDELKKRGYKMGLVTSRLLNTTMQGLETFGIKDYFDAILTADDTPLHKPDPAPINITLEKLGSDRKSSVMLGDTMYDIKCARNAGVTSVLVAWSLALGQTKDFGDDAPDYIINSPGVLFDII